MDLHDIALQRLTNQQLAHPTFKTPAEVVRWMGAVQAQDLLASLFALGRRMTPGSSEAMVEQAIADKTIARSWPMRGTIHFTPPEDLKWMTALLALRILARAASNYRRAELTPDDFARSGEIFAGLLRGTQLTRPQLYQALNQAGIDTGSRNGEQRGMHLIVHWACRGLLCTAPRQGKQQTFALLDEWLPGSRELKGNQAIITLGERYFASHGPATIKDFMWWTGLTATELKPNIPKITANLQRAEVNGAEYWHQPQPLQNAPEVMLLPPFDEYTIAYADRSAVVDTSALRSLGFGLSPNIIINGRIAGTWRRTLKKGSVIITTSLTAPLTDAQKAGLQKAADDYGAFLGATTILQ